jgi:type II secretory pathway component PulK
MRRASPGEQGSALLVALLILLLAFLVLMAVTARASASTRSVAAAQREAHALNAAEAGLAAGVQALLNDEDPDSRQQSLGLATYELETKTLKWMGPRRRVELRSLGRCRADAVLLVAVIDVRLPLPAETYPPPQATLRSWTRKRAD